MKIDYDKLDTYIKTHKKVLEKMSDKEYNNHINQVLEEFHCEEKEKRTNR